MIRRLRTTLAGFPRSGTEDDDSEDREEASGLTALKKLLFRDVSLKTT